MKVTNISNQKIHVELEEKIPTFRDLEPGQSVEGNIANLHKIRKQVRIGENLTEVMPQGKRLNG